ncbi:MAG: transposase family protein, partial [Nostoc sp.]
MTSTEEPKPRNKELTTDQKKSNKAFSSKRVFVEHRIRSVKIFRVVQDRFRLN